MKIDVVKPVSAVEGDIVEIRIVEEVDGVRRYHRTSCLVADFDWHMALVNDHLESMRRQRVPVAELDRVRPRGN